MVLINPYEFGTSTGVESRIDGTPMSVMALEGNDRLAGRHTEPSSVLLIDRLSPLDEPVNAEDKELSVQCW